MAAEIAQLRQQLKFTKETLEDVRDHHGSEIRSYQGELESLKEHKGHIEKIVGELQAKQEGSMGKPDRCPPLGNPAGAG